MVRCGIMQTVAEEKKYYGDNDRRKTVETQEIKGVGGRDEI